MRTAFWVVLAFVAGALVGGAALYDGAPSAAPPRAALPAGDGGVVIVVQNVGTRALNATMEVARLGGGAVWSGVLHVPAQDERDHALAEELTGKHSARGRFTWAEPPRRGTGDFIIAYDAGECDVGTLHVVFRVDSTNGISFPDGEIKECR